MYLTVKPAKHAMYGEGNLQTSSATKKAAASAHIRVVKPVEAYKEDKKTSTPTGSPGHQRRIVKPIPSTSKKANETQISTKTPAMKKQIYTQRLPKRQAVEVESEDEDYEEDEEEVAILKRTDSVDLTTEEYFDADEDNLDGDDSTLKQTIIALQRKPGGAAGDESTAEGADDKKKSSRNNNKPKIVFDVSNVTKKFCKTADPSNIAEIICQISNTLIIKSQVIDSYDPKSTLKCDYPTLTFLKKLKDEKVLPFYIPYNQASYVCEAIQYILERNKALAAESMTMAMDEDEEEDVEVDSD
jgi:hypothetical protein